MFELLSNLLKDHKGNVIFNCFGIWHILIMLLIFGGVITTVLVLNNKNQCTKDKAINLVINLVFGLYILDFFLMPFSYGYIDVDKLPFHICTLMGLMAFMARNNKFLSRFTTEFTLLGLIGALMYISYPSGVADGETFPFSYRVIQTMIYHGLLVAHGVFALTFNDIKLEWKKIYRELFVIILIAGIAIVANNIYSGELGDFNWFFVSADPFGLFPENIAPFIMPFIMIIVIFLMDILIYSIYFGIRKYFKFKTKAEI